jgi:hypothetical protein
MDSVSERQIGAHKPLWFVAKLTHPPWGSGFFASDLHLRKDGPGVASKGFSTFW